MMYILPLFLESKACPLQACLLQLMPLVVGVYYCYKVVGGGEAATQD